MEAGLSTSLWIFDRWVRSAHIPQIYCFSPILGVLSLFKVYNFQRIFVRHTTRAGTFLYFSLPSKAVAALLHRVRQKLNSNVYFFQMHNLFLPICKHVSACWVSFLLS